MRALLEHREQQRQPAGVDAGGDAAARVTGRARATSACTSTSSGRAPSTTGGDDRTRCARTTVGEEQRRRVGHTDEPGLGHLEDAELLRRSEPVLERVEEPEPVVPVAVERQHGVDDVLERARPGEGAVLGDVADEHRRDRVFLREPDQPVRALAHLRERTRDAREVGIGERLDRVDGDDVGPDRLDVGEHARQRRVGDEQQVGGERPEPGGRADGPARPTPRRRRAGSARPAPRGGPSACSSRVDLPIPGSPPSRVTDP